MVFLWIQLSFAHLFIHEISNVRIVHGAGLDVMMYAGQIDKSCVDSGLKELKGDKENTYMGVVRVRTGNCYERLHRL